MDITCSNVAGCENVFTGPDDEPQLQEYARVQGWHLWSGVTLGGEQRVVRLCPECVGRHRRNLPRLPGIVGEQTVIDFDVL